ncbi:PKD domain-containing protein [Rufibacter hautae]|uniref:PKD domain-containing protein n=1 Tax=Rufibacter hautae TaxID=2595005 RepID=A0A5B6TUQ3_9BACT|nr:PKD domain-containing protein [Rufibacter hautae]KAA3440288.1 hypothetical protein FOA19_06425 [Rufibacter hautae]
MKNSLITLLSAALKGRRALFFTRKAGLVSGTVKTLTLLLIALSTFLVSCQEDEEDAPAPIIGVLTVDAGADQTVEVGQTVTLDGSSTKDSRNDSISYNWSLVTKPTGSTSAVTNPKKVKPTFVPDAAGQYKLELTVFSKNGQKKDTVQVTATPKSDPNSATILSTDILSDLVLEDKFTEPGKADYIVTNLLQVKARLTVKPGVIIEFDADKGLEILGQGSLIANGTPSQTITFTGKQKVRGFWKGIFVGSNAEMHLVEVTYGGSSAQREIEVKANVGVWGDHISGASLKATNCSFNNANGYGLAVLGSLGAFYNNSFNDNSKLPLYIVASQIHTLDTESRYNGADKGIGIAGIVPQYITNVTWPLMKDGTNYVAVGDLTMEGSVAIAPGVTIEFMKGAGMYVREMGSLKAIGTAAKKITFTGRAKVKGSWRGIVFRSMNQTSEFAYTEVSYGGETSYNIGGKEYRGNLLLWGDASLPGYEGALTITNSSLTNSAGYGMVVAPGGGYLNDFRSNTFSQNAGAAMYVDPNQIHKIDTGSRLYDNNGYNGLETEGTLNNGDEVEWNIPIGGLRVHVVGDLFVKSGLKMHFDPRGSIGLQFDDNKGMFIQNGGYLIAKGAPGTEVSFTGFHRQSQLGYWKGITFESNSPLNELNDVNVSYAGASGATTLNNTSNIMVKGSAKIINCEIYNGLGWGLYVTRAGTVNADASSGNFFGNNKRGAYLKEK